MVLIIDNYDSFTYNLARYFSELGAQVKVVKNDEISSQQIATLKPTHIVISPGPCTPNESGISKQVIKDWFDQLPILGVCLGHQAIGEFFGAQLIRAQHVRHGKTSTIDVLKQAGLFAKTADRFSVTRYHSLILDYDSVANSDLSVTSVCTEHGNTEVMAFEHKVLPIFGVQFHPESLLTEYGHTLLSNFLKC